MFGPSTPIAAAPTGENRQKVRIDIGGSSEVKDEKTVGIFRTQKGCDPVVGWLVCINGDERGRDYRLHAGRNFIGRSLKSDISLPDDMQISREDHCSIVFEPNKCVFTLIRGGGEVQADDQPIDGSLTLTGDEEITLGASRFILIPFCKEGRTW
jgi:hypothetical protein